MEKHGRSHDMGGMLVGRLMRLEDVASTRRFPGPLSRKSGGFKVQKSKIQVEPGVSAEWKGP